MTDLKLDCRNASWYRARVMGAALFAMVSSARALEPIRRTVTNEAELRQAFDLSRDADVIILVDREIEVNGPVISPRSSNIIKLVGIGGRATIRFNMVFDGNWDKYPQAANGLDFMNRQTIIRGLRFEGYEWRGAAIKGNRDGELLDISDCTFHEIGSLAFPYRKTPADIEDTVYNQCIALHNNNGHFNLSGCRFYRCVLNNRSWSHCVYVSARSVSVTENEFVACGNPFAVGATEEGSVNVFGNRVTSPARVPDRNGNVDYTYLAVLPTTGFTTYMFNVLRGDTRSPFVGRMFSSASQVVDFNDYRDTMYRKIWATRFGGEYLGWNQWRAIGMDLHSAPPRNRE